MERNRKDKNAELEKVPVLQETSDIGNDLTDLNVCRAPRISRWYDRTDADLLTATARLLADGNRDQLSSFGDFASCLGLSPKTASSHPKYRKASGYGNNLQNPYWGSTGAPYGRWGPKTYYDGVYYNRKSATGCCLPCARRLVTNILVPAEKQTRSSSLPSSLFTYVGFSIAQDAAGRINEKPPTDKCDDFRCCFKQNGVVLPELLLNSACYPVQIGQEDAYYSQHNVECLNFIRSQKTVVPGTVAFGEIKNIATGFLDLSLVYGAENSEMQEVRTFAGGKLRVSEKNSLAVDSALNYGCANDRVRVDPLLSVIPALFTRNHNRLCDGLAAQNPGCNDETLFQEARRINIAMWQDIALEFVRKLIPDFEVPALNTQAYDASVDPSASVEFDTAAIRLLNFFLNSQVPFVDEDGTESTELLSDVFGDLEKVEDNLDRVIRGMERQAINTVSYSEEVINHYAKRADGVGIDMISFDIQRGKFSLFVFKQLNARENFSGVHSKMLGNTM